MNGAKHAKRHRELHASLDELLADYCAKANGMPSKDTIIKLLRWSNKQCDPKTVDHGEEDVKARN